LKHALIIHKKVYYLRTRKIVSGVQTSTGISLHKNLFLYFYYL
jgi:hypothetical protein